MQVKNIASRLITSDIVNSMRARAKVSCRRGSESAEMAAWERRAPFQVGTQRFQSVFMRFDSRVFGFNLPLRQ